ncbi:MAG TPA: glycosyltransferase family 9 protein [Blastocatellia bacterium]|nr:glycosyltransferase family 9 protein [Blastocatellia bacterium]
MYSDPRNLLIVHIAGLGETILALPALRSLRHHLSAARVTVASSPVGAEVLQLSGCVNEVLTIGRLRHGEIAAPRATWRSLKSLREASHHRYDLAIEFKSGTESAVLMNFARPLRRLNAPRKGLHRLVGLVTNLLSRSSQSYRHLAQQYLELLEPLGVRPLEAAPKLSTDREADERIEKLLRKNRLKPGELLVGIHPGAGSAQQRWPAERFASLAARFIYNFNARVILLSGPRERGLVRKVAASLPKERIVLPGLPDVSELASMLARLSIFIGNHSGPAHLAAAVGAPVVVASITSGPSPYDLLGRNNTHVRGPAAETIPEEAVYEAACLLLQSSRAERLMAL